MICPPVGRLGRTHKQAAPAVALHNEAAVLANQTPVVTVVDPVVPPTTALAVSQLMRDCGLMHEPVGLSVPVAVDPVHQALLTVGGKTPAFRRVAESDVGLGERLLAQVGDRVAPRGPITGAEGENP
jgi:hypothetical protein